MYGFWKKSSTTVFLYMSGNHNAFTKENSSFGPGLGTHPCNNCFSECHAEGATVSLKNMLKMYFIEKVSFHSIFHSETKFC